MTQSTSGQATPRFGVIGLGAMGGAVVKRLCALGHETVAFDISQRAVEAAVEAGGIAASTAAEAAAVDVLITSLPTDDSLLELMSDAALRRNLAGGTLVEISSILPQTMQQVAALAGSEGIRVVDAPVSGGPSDVLAGTLVLLVGASTDDLDAVRGVLAMLGRVEHVGEVGLGKAIKLVNNVMSISNFVVAAEAFGLGVRLGLSEEQMLHIISESGGRSFMFTKHMPNAIQDDFSPKFALRLSAKDIRLALTAGEHVGYSMGAAAEVLAALDRAMERGLADENFSSVLKVFRP